MSSMYYFEINHNYDAKYGIELRSNWGNKSILRKDIGKKRLFMDTGLPASAIYDMMKTGLEIGTNYLEDCMLAAGKKWTTKNPGLPKRGSKF